MNKTIIIILVIGLILCSCKKDDEYIPLISGYYFGYMDYPSNCMPNPEGMGIVELKYSGSKIIKREGGLIQINPAIGWDYKFIKAIYDEITYSGNWALIKSRVIYQEDTLIIADRKILFDSQGRILQKIQPNDNSIWEMDTFNFYYNLNGLLSKIVNIKEYVSNISILYYNSRNNLDSIVSTKYYDGILYFKTIEYFGGFDNAPNPIKNLVIFNETFNRSLSRNNYKFYCLKKYDSENDLIKLVEKKFILYYDNSGYPLFDKY